MSDEGPHGSTPPADDQAPDPGPRRYVFSLLAIVVLAIMKLHEALVAETMRAAISPSLYTMGLGVFAVSILGPRSLQAVTFLVGAALCLGAIALAARA